MHIPASLQEQKPFQIPLAYVIPYFDRTTGKLQEVFISYDDKNEGWAVSELNDRYVKDTRNKTKEHTHIESYYLANLITDFEAEQIDRVCTGFIRTLEILEKKLDQQQWEQCGFIDSRLTPFFMGFYYLISAARRSKDVLPEVTCISDSSNGSFHEKPDPSPRVQQWKRNPDHVIKLRISIKELNHQIRVWQETEIGNPHRDQWDDRSLQFAKAYELFIRYYFDLEDTYKPSVFRIKK